jgi:hypothetical protein
MAVSTGGYPSVFYAKALDVLPRLGSPPGGKACLALRPA